MIFTRLLAAFFATLYLANLAIMLLVPAKPAGFVWGISTIGMPAYELLFFYLLTCGLWAVRAGWFRWPIAGLCIAVPAVIACFYAGQLSSVLISGEYLSVLALQNASEIGYVLQTGPVLIAVIAVLMIALLATVALRDRWQQHGTASSNRKALALFALVLVLGAVFDRRVDLLPVRVDHRMAPAIRFVETLQDADEERQFRLSVTRFVDDVRQGKLTPPFPFDLENSFPFQRTQDFDAPMPINLDGAPVAQPNVIVVFMEGVSARAMAHYGGPYADLMPNLDRFAQNAITVDNYFGHTAATYRGLHGSLSSIFPIAGGRGGWVEGGDGQPAKAAVVARTLPAILSQMGYDTQFFSPHETDNPFTRFLGELGFAAIRDSSAIANPDQSRHLSDAQLFDGLTVALNEQAASTTQRPFFWASYNVGSHAFRDVPAGIERYGNGENSVLNRFHELDRALGRFLTAFEASPLSASTILIVTSDHAAYPEAPVIAAFDASAGFKRYFIDTIPLIIRHPSTEMPARIDNGVQSSLNLAPTILHLLNARNIDHAFLGQSALDTRQQPEVAWGAIGRDYYRMDRHGVTSLMGRDHTAQETAAIRTIEYQFSLEADGRLFAPDTEN